MKRKRYHGWIYAEQSPGYKDHFSVQFTDENGQSISRAMGYGENGAAKAVDFFETGRNLGPVKLEKTPIGLRVFTVETTPETPKPINTDRESVEDSICDITVDRKMSSEDLRDEIKAATGIDVYLDVSNMLSPLSDDDVVLVYQHLSQKR